MIIQLLKEKQNTIAVFVIFITKSLGVKILNNVAVTKIQLEKYFSATNS